MPTKRGSNDEDEGRLALLFAEALAVMYELIDYASVGMQLFVASLLASAFCCGLWLVTRDYTVMYRTILVRVVYRHVTFEY